MKYFVEYEHDGRWYEEVFCRTAEEALITMAYEVRHMSRRLTASATYRVREETTDRVIFTLTFTHGA
jgi:hypothetical protein